MKSNEERVNSIMKKVALYKRKRGEIISTVTLAVCLAVSVIAGVNLKKYKSSNSGEEFARNTASGEVTINNKEGELLAFSSKEELMDMLEENAKKMENTNQWMMRKGIDMVYDDAVAEESVDAPTSINANASKSAADSSMGGNSSDHSETNIQTEGVDESDIIKTDGKRIYYMSSERKDVKIFEDVNGEIKLVTTIQLSNNKEEYHYGDSMFLDDKYLVVIAYGSQRMYDEPSEEIQSNTSKKLAYIPYRTKSFTEVFIYDVNTYDLIRKVETEGNLVSSRKIGDNLYLVSNKYLNYYQFYRDDVIPVYKDTSISKDYCELAIENIRGFKDFEKEEQCNYMIITSLNLSDSKSKVNIETYLGAGTEIYCSTNHLYVTKPNYNYAMRSRMILIDSIALPEEGEATSSTNIHKFAIKDGKTTYVATGKVTGTLLNQFSMDEYDGKFRITTTDNTGNNYMYQMKI